MSACPKQIALLPLALFPILAAYIPARSVASEASSTTGPQLRGVNRAGAEYGDYWCGWSGPNDFEWARDDLPRDRPVAIRTNELDYFASKGMNVVRLPISWERLQHTLYGPIDPTYQADLVAYVDAATSKGLSVVIDLHNYGRYATGAHDSSGAEVNTYTQHILGDGMLTFDHVADVWRRIAALFVGNPRVIFNLMNEQHDAGRPVPGALPEEACAIGAKLVSTLDATAIFAGYQAVLNAVRATGATQLVLFPNTRSSDTHHWSTWWPQGGPPLDSDAALRVTDSANNLAFDMHSYEGCDGCDSWNDDIKVVTDWARANGKRLFLSELGTESGSAAVSTLLACINSNSDVWVGWTVWNLDPYRISTTDRDTGVVSDTTKMPWYAPYFSGPSSTATPC
jgi:endoglucanase